MKKVKNIKKIGLFIIILLIVSTIVFFSNHNKKEYKINKILKNEYYSYLPDEAKEYVKEVYEKTGEIVYTEKNKQENVPYLNPRYVEYLGLSAEEKEQTDEIPQMYTIEFSTDGNSNLPTSYDLRNINGNNYISPIKDQEKLDLCWDFTTLEQAESYLMVKNGAPYNSSSEVFSARQIDYASSTDGIKDYENPSGTRELTSGGNFLAATLSLVNGEGLIYDNKMPFSNTTEKKELYDVLNYNNIKYELNNSIYMPSVNSTTPAEERQNYINKIKELVMENGGAYIGTQAPGYSCSALNTDGNVIIDVEGTCSEDGGHSMQIIGWDDNYTYKYCKRGDEHTQAGSCSGSNLVQGQGAWILRNSWGNIYPYAYLAYNSNEDDVYFMTSITGMNERTWDNNYHKNLSPFYIYYGKTDEQYFEKISSTSEKLEKIKFFAFGQNGIYNISVTSGRTKYNNVKQVTVEYPGIYTVDLSDKDIHINDTDFSIKVASSNNTNLIKESISAYTSNDSEDPEINIVENSLSFNRSNKDYSFRVYSKTKNIPSDSTITYSLKDKNGEDCSNYLTVSNNKVAKNDVNSLINISHGIIKGIYRLVLNYSNTSAEVNIKIGDVNNVIQYNSNFDPNTVITRTYESLSTVQIPATIFSRTGYSIGSWNTKADGSGETYLNLQIIEGIEDDLVLYAQWTPNTYTIEYNPNGGTGNMETQMFTYDTPQNLRNNTFVHSEYQFVSWNTKADGTGTFYNDEQEVLNLTAVQGKRMTLYAQWNRVPDVYYKTHVQDYGWQNYVKNGAVSGTSGQSKRLEAIKIKVLNKAYSGNIEYRTHVQDYGWQNYVKNDALSGTSHESKRLEAIQIRLTGDLAVHYDVYYRVHAQDVGWMNWAKNDELSGTAGYGRRLEGIEVVIVEKGELPPNRSDIKTNKTFLQKQLIYTTHVQDYGWQAEVADGTMAGTSHESKRLEAIKIRLNKQEYIGNIEYKTHVQDYGWQSYVRNGAVSGTNGQSKRLEAISIRLTDQMAEHYDIYYRVHAQEFGWMGWAKNGENAGTAHYSYRLEAIEIVMVDKGESPPTRTNTNTNRAFVDKNG